MTRALQDLAFYEYLFDIVIAVSLSSRILISGVAVDPSTVASNSLTTVLEIVS